MTSTIEHGQKVLHRHNKPYAPSIVALERMRHSVRRLSIRMEKYDVRLKAIEFKLNFIWAVTVMLLALALGMVAQSISMG